MKKNIKSLLLLAVLTFSLLGIVACNDGQQISETSEPVNSQAVEKQVTQKPSEEQENNSHDITLSIYNIDEEAIYSETISTEKTNLFEIISSIDALQIISENSEGGKFIVSIMDTSYCYGQYWNCYINGEYLLDNISLYEINDNDVIDFRYEKVGE